jgi:hypothetical protein
MEKCEFRKMYLTVDKVGLVCTKNDGERRITCELVCEECDLGKNFPEIDVNAEYDESVLTSQDMEDIKVLHPWLFV